MDVQGWVVVGLAFVLFGYLVPHLVHSRHQMAQSRVEDRFSGTLRVVTTGATAKRSSPGEHHGIRESRPYLHGPRRRTEAPAVNRPTTPGERAAAEARRLAQLRAARAAEISRRKAAAKRRLVLTIVLLLASVAGWVGFGAAGLSVALGIVPTVLLGTVLVLGRRAAKIAARRNAADRAAMARLELRPAPRTRPAPSARAATTATTAPEDHPAPAEAVAAAETSSVVVEEAPAAPTSEVDGATDAVAATEAPVKAAQPWTPVPVPAPSYTLKASAPRRDIAPYEAPRATSASAEPTAPERSAVAPAESEPGLPAERVPAAAGLAGSPYAPVADPEPEAAPEPEALPARGLDLDSVLARRRAVGA